MSKYITSALMLVAAMLVAVNSWAIAEADWKAVPSPSGNGTVEVTEGDTVAAVFTFVGSCSDFDPSKLVIDPVPEGAARGGCKSDSLDSRMATALWSWKAQPGLHSHTVKYSGSFERTYSFSGKAAYDPSAHPSAAGFADHVEDDSMHGGGLKDGSFQILGQIGGMPNDKYTQRPTFLARLLLNATLARARWGGGFKLGLLGGYGETNFRVSPTFASLTEEAPVRIGEWALMPQFTHRPVSWFEWNAGIPLGLRYYSYEAQILSLDPGNPDALENNNRQFAFWTGFYIDAQLVIADYLSVGGFAQFSMNPTKVDVMIGDGQDKGELMPQFAGGAMIGLDL